MGLDRYDVRPGALLEGTLTGKPRWQPSGVAHHPLRGQRVSPAHAPQLIRLTTQDVYRSLHATRNHRSRRYPGRVDDWRDRSRAKLRHGRTYGGLFIQIEGTCRSLWYGCRWFAIRGGGIAGAAKCLPRCTLVVCHAKDAGRSLHEVQSRTTLAAPKVVPALLPRARWPKPLAQGFMRRPCRVTPNHPLNLQGLVRAHFVVLALEDVDVEFGVPALCRSRPLRLKSWLHASSTAGDRSCRPVSA